MPRPEFHLKPTHKAVTDYYDQLQTFDRHNASHEGAVRSALQNLLDFTARKKSLSLIPEYTTKAKRGNKIRIDGVIQDDFGLIKGGWEAKDVDDNIDDAVRAKIQAGYPLSNIIFENTRTGVLYQGGMEVQRYDLTDSEQLTSLINTFFDYREPEHVDFEKAVDDFKDKVADIALKLNSTIKQAHKDNRPFQTAFNSLYEICRESLNRNIRKDAIDEMIIQHLLTERLISKIFQNSDFKNRNIIASEVEKVISALTIKSFSREEFLKNLDRFYVAIENAALAEPDFDRRLVILNNVYEKFFQGYSVKVADTHGIVYTPPEIVDFMCKSVVEALKREFGKTLGDEDVVVLDPCTGTGSFVVKMLELAEGRYLEDFYRKRLFANEVMLMPYYIASLTIEHKYYERMGRYEPFGGICFVDTLDMVGSQQNLFINAKNTERIRKQQQSNITVIIGNPPYNAGQQNENDNNKNRRYDSKEQGDKAVDVRIQKTYSKDSSATLSRKLYDPYVRFFRWATDRLGDRDGIICYVSNNSFVENIVFDGMRKHLLEDFDIIFLLDLKGNVRKDSMREGLPIGEKHTVFGLSAMVGISVCLLIKKKGIKKQLKFSSVDWKATRIEKFDLINKCETVSGVDWQTLTPDARHTWLRPAHAEKFDGFIPLGVKQKKHLKNTETIFLLYSLGVATNRDIVVYNFEKSKLKEKVSNQIEHFNNEVIRFLALNGTNDIDDLINYKVVLWSSTLKNKLRRGKLSKFSSKHIRKSMYRPFTSQTLYYDNLLIDRPGKFKVIFPTPATEQENRVIVVGVYGRVGMATIVSKHFTDINFFRDPAQNFPFYIYNEDGSNRRENITDWSLETFRDHYGDQSISKWDIFYYVYALLHHPEYRSLFGDCLKRDLPRIPFTADFRGFANAGHALAELHLNYETVEPYNLTWQESKDKPIDWRVEKMRLSRDKRSLIYNDWLTMGGIPEAAFEYRLGNRSALDWIIDQYRVKRDSEGGIISDPNRQDDERYIVDLVGRIITVSLETQRIVGCLPGLGIVE